MVTYWNIQFFRKFVSLTKTIQLLTPRFDKNDIIVKEITNFWKMLMSSKLRALERVNTPATKELCKLKSRIFFSYVSKALWLIYIPFSFPAKFFKLISIALVNPRLMGEVIHLYKIRNWLNAKNFSTVIDVGSFIGSYSFGMSLFLPKTKIIAFEPLPENYSAMNKNMSIFSNYQAYNCALGNSTGEVDFYSNQFSPSSSLLELTETTKQLYPFAAKTLLTKVTLEKLDNLIDRVDIEPPAIIKIDAQGYELEILLGANECLKLIDSVYLEVSFLPLYKDQCDFDSIYKFLTVNGFEFKGSFEPNFSDNGSLIQCDVLFCKKLKKDK